MKKLYSFFTAAAALATLVCSNACAFEISAYWDPISMVQLEGHGSSGLQNCPGDTDRACWINAISVTNNSWVLERYQEMGITNLCVHYRPTDFQDFLGASGESLAVMNERWPGRMYQYLEAQGWGRRIVVADPLSPYLDPSLCTGSYGCSTYFPDPPHLGVPTLAIGPGDGTPQEFFRPAVGFDTWKGWARREFGEDWNADGALEYVMPMVFRLVLDYERDPNAPTAEIGKFYWYFKNAEDAWLRYHPVTIDTTMIQRQAGQFDTLVIRIDPIDYTYARDRVGLDTVIYSCDDPFDWTWDPTGTLDMDYFGYYDVSWSGREGRFEIRYSGYHTLYLYSVQAMDDAYYRIFEAPDSVVQATETMIADSFWADKIRWPHMRGWYYDEIHGDFLRSWLRVNKILHDTTLPTFYFNGFAFDDNRQNLQMDSMYYLFDHGYEGSQPSTFMYETYYFYGETDSVSLMWNYPPYFFTRYDSDEPYLDADCTGLVDWGNNHFSKQFDGTQSLQRAIDWTYWRVPDSTACRVLSSEQCTNIASLELYPGFIDQVRLQHARGGKLWALLQAGRASGHSRVNTWRDPSPQEIKLEVWMAVASDADGIMWYWGIPSGPGPHPAIGGLFNWDDNSDFCESGGASVDTTERWSAAKKVNRELERVTPILESLEFVKTYASRAFQLDYPDRIGLLECPALQLDTLAHESWYDQDYRCVESIQSWVPSSFNQDTTAVTAWSANPEEHTYVQISRFRSDRTPPNEEDDWFLIVNRRALPHEFRKIRLTIEVNQSTMCLRRWADYVLGDSMVVTEMPGNREDCHPTRYLDVVLRPGEPELVHFFRDLLPCDTGLAHIHQLTALHRDDYGINLHWEEITETDSGEAFSVDTFFVQKSRYFNGPYATIGFSTTTSYVDTSGWSDLPRCFYQVQACGHIEYRTQSAPPPTPSFSKKH